MSKNKNIDLHKQSSKGKAAEVAPQTEPTSREHQQNKR
ncbi:hypothetical protein BBOR36S_02103 [Brevibacillus borstelensis]|jgi:hypothetical protein